MTSAFKVKPYYLAWNCPSFPMQLKVKIEDHFEQQVIVISVHDSNKYFMLCWAEMSLPSLGGKKKENYILWRKFCPMSVYSCFSEFLLESHECSPKKIQADLESNHFRQAFYLVRTTNTREGCNANRIGAPNSQLCAVNSVLLNSAFNLILLKNSLINSEAHTLRFILL